MRAHELSSRNYKLHTHKWRKVNTGGIFFFVLRVYHTGIVSFFIFLLREKVEKVVSTFFFFVSVEFCSHFYDTKTMIAFSLKGVVFEKNEVAES